MSKQMGCLPRQTPLGSRFPVWRPEPDEEFPACPIVPRDDWQSQEPLDWAEYNDVDQNGDPACCLASLANAGEFHLAITGRERVKLDWHAAWMTLSGGRGGVALDTALAYIVDRGFPIIGSTERLFALEVWDCPSIESLASGIQRGCRGIYGRWIGNGGHAEFPAFVTVASRKANFEVRGTWGRDYGRRGWYTVSEADILRTYRRMTGIEAFGAFLVREWKIRKADTDGLPDAT